MAHHRRGRWVGAGAWQAALRPSPLPVLGEGAAAGLRPRFPHRGDPVRGGDPSADPQPGGAAHHRPAGLWGRPWVPDFRVLPAAASIVPWASKPRPPPRLPPPPSAHTTSDPTSRPCTLSQGPPRPRGAPPHILPGPRSSRRSFLNPPPAAELPATALGRLQLVLSGSRLRGGTLRAPGSPRLQPRPHPALQSDGVSPGLRDPVRGPEVRLPHDAHAR